MVSCSLFSLREVIVFFFFFSSRRRHTRWPRDWSSDVCSSDLCFYNHVCKTACKKGDKKLLNHLRIPLLSFFKKDRKSTRLNSSHVAISYAVFCLKKKKKRHRGYR